MTGIFLNVPKVTLDVIEKNEHDIFDQITKFVVEITRNIPDYTKKLPQRGLIHSACMHGQQNKHM